jgi:hypothetical protein
LALLQPVVEAAKKGILREHHQQGAVWLARTLQHEGAATKAAAVAQQLISLPSVPLDWAVQLLAAGVRTSYSQLLDAASSSLAGVEVWVQAQQQLRVQTDIPAVAVAICCGDDWVSDWTTMLLCCWLTAMLVYLAGIQHKQQQSRQPCSAEQMSILLQSAETVITSAYCGNSSNVMTLIARLHNQMFTYLCCLFSCYCSACFQDLTSLSVEEAGAGHTAALLQLALNCSNSATAEAGVRHLPEQLEAGAARKLLLTAAARQHTGSVRSMLSLPGMQQHIDADTLMTMLVQLLPHSDCVLCLSMLPAGQQLSCKQVEGLLFAAIDAGSATDMSWCAIAVLPATRQLSCDQVEGLLLAAVKQECVFSTAVLCSVPAAQQLSCKQMTDLVLAAIQEGSAINTNVGTIAKLPAAKHLSCKQVEDLLVAAVKQERVIVTFVLCQLPAAQQLSCKQVEGLILASKTIEEGSTACREPGSVTVAKVLCKELPAAHKASAGL